MEWQGKKYWLVGASDGLGLALAQVLSTKGAEVVLSARSLSALERAADLLPNKAHVLALDVADGAAVRRAAQHLGPIDGVVYLAGVYWPMRAQEWQADQVEAMCDINFTGCARVIGAVLPGMIARNQGHIVITGSLSGFRGLPGAIGYAASKSGVMALAESLYCDLRDSPIRVQLANPGFIKTRLTDKNDFAMPFMMTAPEAAAHIVDLMESRTFKVSFPTVFSWLFRLSQFMPDWLYYPIFAPRAKKDA
jgi:NADP-dependent 3-hydroxy acid dehydrogenase YdfG